VNTTTAPGVLAACSGDLVLAVAAGDSLEAPGAQENRGGVGHTALEDALQNRRAQEHQAGQPMLS
jgi:hypothetical protein